MNAGNLIGNRYLIQKLLGQGGFGRTYLVYDTQRFGESCVLKEFVPANMGEDTLRKARELFEREAKILYHIDHPQIPKFIAWLTDKQKIFIVQQYIEGKTYSQLLRERLVQTGKAFSEAEVTQWMWDMLPVLDYIHRNNLIHRDISLDNVMLPADESKPVLIDFGLVKEKVSQIWSVNKSQRSSFGSAVGKFGYAPSEQIRKGVCYPCSDVYTLGVCAVVMLTGKAPDLLLNEDLDWQWHSDVKISKNLTRILDKMLAEKPVERYQSANEILKELELPNFPEEVSAIYSFKKIEINIDQDRRERQVAEIVESDEFKLLEQRVNQLKTQTETLTNTALQVQQPVNISVIQKATGFSISSEETVFQKPLSQPLNPEFITCCEQELNRLIGPYAAFLVREVLAESPHLTREEFVEALAGGISDPKQSQNFKQRIEKVIKSQSAKHNGQAQANAAVFNKEFIEHCRQELLLCLGPVANFVLDDILSESPGITTEQLVECLIKAIEEPKQIEKFKKRLQIPKP